MNILKKTYRKLTSRKYNIGFVENSLKGILQGEPYRVKWMKHSYTDRWFADPFILDVRGNEAQVLVEEFYDPAGRGRIAKLLIDLDTMQLINTTPVLELNTHLSFPAILRREGRIYIYPENYAGGGLNLYEYLPESNECKRVKHLTDELLTDAVYTEMFGEPLIFSTCEPDANGAVLGVYQQKESTGMYQLVQECKFDEPIARNAGAWFMYEGEVYRPAQDSAVCYGHKLVIQKVRREVDGGFSFREVRRDTSPLKGMGLGFHTFNVYKDHIVVDCQGYRMPFPGRLLYAFRRMF